MLSEWPKRLGHVWLWMHHILHKMSALYHSDVGLVCDRCLDCVYSNNEAAAKDKYPPPFLFYKTFGDKVDMSVSLPPDKLWEIQQLVPSLLHMQPGTVHQVMSLLERAIFVPMDIHSFAVCVTWFRVTCWMFIISLLTYFIPFAFLYQLCINFGDLSCKGIQFSCSCLFLMWLSSQMLCPLLGLIFSGFWFTLSFYRTWSGSICTVHIAFQKLQVVVLMLHRLAFDCLEML